MSDYSKRLSRPLGLPPVPRIIPRYQVLSSGRFVDTLGVSLATPGIENWASRALAARFNENSNHYDAAIDRVFNETRVGGSTLHHNLDGSHTFEGALAAVRNADPDAPSLERTLGALEHLARDFTTPSGINPLLSPMGFQASKSFLTTLGLSLSTANDLLNLNAAELAGGVLGPGLLFLRGSLRADKRTLTAAHQIGRLAATYFFAGNAVGLLVTAAAFLRTIVDSEPDASMRQAGRGVGELVVAAALFPAMPISTVFILATACSAWWHWLNSDSMAQELECIFQHQFPAYRSYLAQLSVY